MLAGVGIQVVGAHAHDPGGDVGAVVGNALGVGEHVQEQKPRLDAALAGLQAGDVVLPHDIAHPVHRLLQGLHLGRQGGVHLGKGLAGDVLHLAHRLEQQGRLLFGGGREAPLLLRELAGAVHQVHGVVANALVFAHEFQQLAHRVALALGELLVADTDEVVGDGHLHLVQQFLPVGHAGRGIRVEFCEQAHRLVEVGAGAAGHLLHRVLGLLQGHRRALQQALVQHRHGQVRRLPLLFGDGVLRQPGQRLGEGHEQQGDHHVEQGVEVGDVALVHHLVPEGEEAGGLQAVDPRQEHGGADDVEVKVHDGAALGRGGRAHGGDQRGGAGADVLAQDDGDGAAPGDHAGAGQRLQNAHAGAAGLDGHGDQRARQHAQHGVLQLGEQLHKEGAVL